MIKSSNPVIQTAASKVMQLINDKADLTAIQSAFGDFGSAIAESVRQDYESAYGDKNLLAQRGFRVLTTDENKYFNGIIQAAHQPTVQAMNDYMNRETGNPPETIFEDVFKNLQTEHPLLSQINFVSVKYLTRFILNDHSQQTAVWGEINSAIEQQIDSAFRVIEMTQCKLSAYAKIALDMIDLGPSFLDKYIRTFLTESIALALEAGIISGTGKNQPIGLDRDIHHGVSVTDGAYPQKTAVTVTDFLPASYGELLATLAETEVWYSTTTDLTTAVASSTAANSDGSAKAGYVKHGGAPRKFDKVVMVVNQKDYLQKIMPATTVLNAAGAYTKDIFPFPTEVVRSTQMASGKALIFLPDEYFLGIAGTKEGTISFSDEYKFLEDARYFKVKMFANGRAYDNTVAILADISSVSAAYITVLNKTE